MLISGDGFLFAFVLQMFIKFKAAVPLWNIIVGFLTSAAVGLAVGIFSVLVAKIDPMAAIT
jgi:hypothetical protein